MPSYDFDFQRYIERKKGAREAEAREGSVYAYGGDLGLRRSLLRLRPVALALEATVRLWRGTARAEVLGPAVRASDRSYPAVHEAAVRAASVLHVMLPPVSVSPGLAIAAGVFGTDEEPQVLLHAGLAEALSPDELAFVIGVQLGHVQNRHVLLLTSYYFLDRLRGSVARMAAAPARVTLSAFRRRAQITADRAGLLATRNLDVARAALDKMAALDEELSRNAPSPTGGAVPTSAVRARSLELFAQGAYYRGIVPPPAGSPPAATARETDRAIAQLLKTGAPDDASDDDADPLDPNPADPSSQNGPSSPSGKAPRR